MDSGQCLLDQGRLDDALRFFELGYALHPGMDYRQLNLARALYGAGRAEEAALYAGLYAKRHGLVSPMKLIAPVRGGSG